MAKHRITYVSNIDFTAATKTFSGERADRQAWEGIVAFPAFISYAVWHEADVGIRAEHVSTHALVNGQRARNGEAPL
jgi:hypothetical protein